MCTELNNKTRLRNQIITETIDPELRKIRQEKERRINEEKEAMILNHFSNPARFSSNSESEGPLCHAESIALNKRNLKMLRNRDPNMEIGLKSENINTSNTKVVRNLHKRPKIYDNLDENNKENVSPKIDPTMFRRRMVKTYHHPDEQADNLVLRPIRDFDTFPEKARNDSNLQIEEDSITVKQDKEEDFEYRKRRGRQRRVVEESKAIKSAKNSIKKQPFKEEIFNVETAPKASITPLKKIDPNIKDLYNQKRINRSQIRPNIRKLNPKAYKGEKSANKKLRTIKDRISQLQEELRREFDAR